MKKLLLCLAVFVGVIGAFGAYSQTQNCSGTMVGPLSGFQLNLSCTTASAVSPPGTTITGPTTATVTDGSLVVWGLGASGGGGNFFMVKNGVVDTTSVGLKMEIDVHGDLWVQNAGDVSAGLWWHNTHGTNTWVHVGGPPPLASNGPPPTNFARAQAVINNLGANSHLHYGDTEANIASAMAYLGIKLIRDDQVSWNGGPSWNDILALGAAGYRFNAANSQFNCSNNASSWLGFLLSAFDALEAAHPGMVVSVEGMNEINNFGVCWITSIASSAATANGSAVLTLPVANPILQVVNAGYGSQITVTGTGIPANTTISSVTSATVTLSAPTTGVASGVMVTFTANNQNPAGGMLYQQTMFDAVHADQNLAGVYVVNFTGCCSPQFGDHPFGIVGSADYNNAHIYSFQGNQPLANIANSVGHSFVSGLGPLAVTETGFCLDTSNNNCVSQIAAARMTVNNILDMVGLGYGPIYLYELFDELTDPFGLFNSDATPRPAATAVRNFVNVLTDTDAAALTFTPTTPGFIVSGLSGDNTLPNFGGHSLVVQKANGTYEVVLWNEEQIYNSTTHTDITPPTSTVTINLGQTYASVNVYDVVTGAVQHLSNVSSVTVSLIADPMIVEVLPAQAAATSVTIEDTDASVIYSSPNSAVNANWGPDNNALNHGSSVHYASYCALVPPQQSIVTQGAQAVFNFTGTGVTLLGRKDTTFGIGVWSIDGGPKTPVDAYSPSPLYQQPLVSVTGLADGAHVLTYEVTCNKNAASSNYYQGVDAFVVTGSHPAGLPTSAGSVVGAIGMAYVPGTVSCCPTVGPIGNNWSVANTAGSTNTNQSGSQSWNGVAGTTASWSFTGSLIEIFGRPDVGDGLFNVTIDGNVVATNVDMHYGTVDNDAMSGYMVWAAKIAPGNHTMTVTVVGREGPNGGAEASGLQNLVQLDQFLAFQ